VFRASYPNQPSFLNYVVSLRFHSMRLSLKSKTYSCASYNRRESHSYLHFNSSKILYKTKDRMNVDTKNACLLFQCQSFVSLINIKRHKPRLGYLRLKNCNVSKVLHTVQHIALSLQRILTQGICELCPLSSKNTLHYFNTLITKHEMKKNFKTLSKNTLEVFNITDITD